MLKKCLCLRGARVVELQLAVLVVKDGQRFIVSVNEGDEK